MNKIMIVSEEKGVIDRHDCTDETLIKNLTILHEKYPNKIIWFTKIRQEKSVKQ